MLFSMSFALRECVIGCEVHKFVPRKFGEFGQRSLLIISTWSNAQRPFHPPEASKCVWLQSLRWQRDCPNHQGLPEGSQWDWALQQYRRWMWCCIKGKGRSIGSHDGLCEPQHWWANLNWWCGENESGAMEVSQNGIRERHIRRHTSKSDISFTHEEVRIRFMRNRLHKIAIANRDQHFKWSVTYFGWTA